MDWAHRLRRGHLSWRQTVSSFWEHYPAFYFGFFFLIGVVGRSNPLPIFLGFFLLSGKKSWRTLFLVGAGFLFPYLFSSPSIPVPLEGSGVFRIKEVNKYSSHFASYFVYEGIVENFRANGEKKGFPRIPCRIYLPRGKNRPRAHRDYFFPSATLSETAPHHYVLKVRGKEAWIPVENSHSLAEWRFQLKERCENYINRHYRGKRERTLMSALLTGRTENRLLVFQFGEVGLNHLLVISGFHFALIGAFLLYFFRRCFSDRMAYILLLISLTLYFFYMGATPSLQRAWVGVLLFFLGLLFDYRPTALNALGIALLVALLCDALVAFDIGWQLSFAATAGILLFYSPFEKKLRSLFPKRPYGEVVRCGLLEQCGYFLTTYLRNTLAVNGAVFTPIFPLLLFYFHRFSLLGLAYNLLFPPLFGLLLLLFFLALFFPPLHFINRIYATFLLDLVSYAPKRLMFCLRIYTFPPWVLAILLIGVFSWGIYAHRRATVVVK